MIELDEIELRLLEGMGVRKLGELFFDLKNNGRVFQFVRKYDQCDYNCKLARTVPSEETSTYVSGSRGLILTREYRVQDTIYIKERKVDKFRILDNGVWYILAYNRDTYTCELSIEHDKSEKITKDVIKKPDETSVVRFGQDFPKELIKSRREPWENDYPDESPEYELAVSTWEDVGFTLSIHGDRLHTHITCDGKTINFGDSPEESLPFSYENFVSIVKKHIGTKKVLNGVAPFMCNVVIPIMVDYTMQEIEHLLTLRESDEDNRQLECLSSIYEEFAKYVKTGDDVNGKGTLNKHPGEVRN